MKLLFCGKRWQVGQYGPPSARDTGFRLCIPGFFFVGLLVALRYLTVNSADLSFW
jgi:hypothetical protein